MDSRALEPNLPALTEHFRVFLPERRGHGRTLDVLGDYSYELMAQDTAAFLKQVVVTPARLLGVSDGLTQRFYRSVDFRSTTCQTKLIFSLPQ